MAMLNWGFCFFFFFLVFAYFSNACAIRVLGADASGGGGDDDMAWQWLTSSIERWAFGADVFFQSNLGCLLQTNWRIQQWYCIDGVGGSGDEDRTILLWPWLALVWNNCLNKMTDEEVK